MIISLVPLVSIFTWFCNFCQYKPQSILKKKKKIRNHVSLKKWNVTKLLACNFISQFTSAQLMQEQERLAFELQRRNQVIPQWRSWDSQWLSSLMVFKLSFPLFPSQEHRLCLYHKGAWLSAIVRIFQIWTDVLIIRCIRPKKQVTQSCVSTKVLLVHDPYLKHLNLRSV